MPSARAVPAAVVLLVVAAILPARAGLLPADEESRGSTPVRGPVRSVVVDVPWGAVTVGQGRTAGVAHTKRWSFREPSVTTTLKDGVLTVTGHCPGLVEGPLVYAGDPVSTCSTDVVVTLTTVPAAVRVRSWDGGVRVTSVAGPVTVDSGDAGTVLQHVRGGAVDVRSDGGAVSLVDVAATTLRTSSGTGDAGLTAVSATGSATVTTEGGAVRVSRLSVGGALAVSSSTADQSLVDVRAGGTSLITNGGAVALTRAVVRSLVVDSSTGATALTGVSIATPARVKTTGGNVVLDGVRGPSLGSSSGTGSTTVKASAIRVLSLGTDGGYARVDHTAFTDLDVTTGTGAAAIAAVQRFAKLDVETSGGDVEALVPPGRYATRLRTSGRASVDGITQDARAQSAIVVDAGTGTIAVHGR